MNPIRKFLNNKKSVTLTEMLISMLLLSIVLLAVSALYVASQKFYFSASDKIIIGYELQYAIQHIYKDAMKGIGDNGSPAIEVSGASDDMALAVNINTDDPLTRDNYSSVANYTYSKSSGGELIFNNGSSSESLVPKVTVTKLNFAKDTNVLTGNITAAYKTRSMTLYFACYPRLATFR